MQNDMLVEGKKAKQLSLRSKFGTKIIYWKVKKYLFIFFKAILKKIYEMSQEIKAVHIMKRL